MIHALRIEDEWHDADRITPEIKRPIGSVIAVRVRNTDGTEDILGWDGKTYWTTEEPKPFTHFKFLR